MSSHFKSFMLNKFIIQYINQIENLWKNYANILKKENLKGTIVFSRNLLLLQLKLFLQGFDLYVCRNKPEFNLKHQSLFLQQSNSS